VDAISLASLQEALPGWEIVPVNGVSAASLAQNWAPGSADLLIVGARANATETLGLCRILACPTSYATGARQEAAQQPPHADNQDPAARMEVLLLVLVPPGQATLAGAALEAGAQHCLLLPIHPKEVASMLTPARAGNQPGRHTLNLEQTQRVDPWRDDGGQG
jgi:hypothetical protein